MFSSGDKKFNLENHEKLALKPIEMPVIPKNIRVDQNKEPEELKADLYSKIAYLQHLDLLDCQIDEVDAEVSPNLI